ncbi:hypothetical protein [Actinomadura rubrisoli]|uniref:SH3 domain-containing protein n=1 Tax=Actinomadura rubrisoli TaxID=2530368 RepID=A0A4R5BEP9_9ACTN|nr:hypothetical protein [Actinomadura rubrisoli]TDD84085.1 hypothetical protein E1298_20385 [Actinomadura rubrisoli]
MRSTIRTGIALSISGLATGGLALLAPASEAQVTTAPTSVAVAQRPPVCRYTVEARHGLHVRQKPGGRILGVLPNGKIIFADCRATHGWVQLRGGVKQKFVGKYVAHRYLARY